MDHLSKQIHLAPAPGHIGAPLSAETCADLFFSYVVKHHGLPDVLVSDRGSQWLSQFWRALFKHCGTNLRFSCAYHPQTDGLSERSIRSVIDTLRCCLDSTHETWDEHLDAIELALNSSVSASTGLAPFEILYGYNVRLPLTLPSATDSAPTSWLSTQVTLRHPSHIVFLTFRYRPQPILWIFHFLASFRRKTIFHCSTPSLRSSDNSRILLVNIFGSSSFC